MRRPVFSRRSFTSGAAAAAIAPAGLAAAIGQASRQPAAAPAQGEVRRITMYAEPLPNGEMGYGLEPGKATIPGPLLEMYEGDTLQIDLVNNLDVPVSLHVHGVDYAIDSDGTAMNDGAVQPGESRLYTWNTHAPGRREDGTVIPGSAGYWHYHDHVVGTEHGTLGLQKGLYGPLVVRRRGDILPDKQFTIVFNDMTINNRTGDETPHFTAKLGERCEIIMITHGEYYHTFHLHGHRWADNRTGMLVDENDPSRIIDNKITGPADSFGFQFIAGEHVGPGHWMYHCHVQSHSDMGMAGIFTVTNEDGTVPGDPPGGHG
ncbi:multicopper oxidase domain-containing protein [Streptomyces sp. 7-21]|mgnify:CR=1 FL=1|jgi:FtsP/CotA-like multicopper oxidase with cupredoxin domain|uniref:multicopper oxidase domain-containing protein n=1 Tax=Streptomyces sp. 7-21 TaxID=2802283 RepID=UPI00191C957E|nr:multicopper oxidase domain-containing protein [Streptomyces sp. 7-21]MBL1068623.1 multicopper oxidase domain-containing protein [Streptomyces sp. 7-21]